MAPPAPPPQELPPETQTQGNLVSYACIGAHENHISLYEATTKYKFSLRDRWKYRKKCEKNDNVNLHHPNAVMVAIGSYGCQWVGHLLNC